MPSNHVHAMYVPINNSRFPFGLMGGGDKKCILW